MTLVRGVRMKKIVVVQFMILWLTQSVFALAPQSYLQGENNSMVIVIDGFEAFFTPPMSSQERKKIVQEMLDRWGNRGNRDLTSHTQASIGSSLEGKSNAEGVKPMYVDYESDEDLFGEGYEKRRILREKAATESQKRLVEQERKNRENQAQLEEAEEYKKNSYRAQIESMEVDPQDTEHLIKDSRSFSEEMQKMREMRAQVLDGQYLDQEEQGLKRMVASYQEDLEKEHKKIIKDIEAGNIDAVREKLRLYKNSNPRVFKYIEQLSVNNNKLQMLIKEVKLVEELKTGEELYVGKAENALRHLFFLFQRKEEYVSSPDDIKLNMLILREMHRVMINPMKDIKALQKKARFNEIMDRVTSDKEKENHKHIRKDLWKILTDPTIIIKKMIQERDIELRNIYLQMLLDRNDGYKLLYENFEKKGEGYPQDLKIEVGLILSQNYSYVPETPRKPKRKIGAVSMDVVVLESPTKPRNPNRLGVRAEATIDLSEARASKADGEHVVQARKVNAAVILGRMKKILAIETPQKGPRHEPRADELKIVIGTPVRKRREEKRKREEYLRKDPIRSFSDDEMQEGSIESMELSDDSDKESEGRGHKRRKILFDKDVGDSSPQAAGILGHITKAQWIQKGEMINVDSFKEERIHGVAVIIVREGYMPEVVMNLDKKIYIWGEFFDELRKQGQEIFQAALGVLIREEQAEIKFNLQQITLTRENIIERAEEELKAYLYALQGMSADQLRNAYQGLMAWYSYLKQQGLDWTNSELDQIAQRVEVLQAIIGEIREGVVPFDLTTVVNDALITNSVHRNGSSQKNIIDHVRESLQLSYSA